MRDGLIRIVLGLAIFSGFISIFILFTPFVPTTSEMSVRADVSAAVATTFALISGVIAIVVTSLVNSSDYKAEQKVKEDIVLLLNALRSMQYKSSMAIFGELRSLDLEEEKRTLREFNVSTTAFAFWAWIGGNSWESKYDGTNMAEWRLFFLQLNKLIEGQEPQKISVVSDEIIQNVLRLTAKDRRQQSKFMSDISSAVEGFKKSSEKISSFRLLVVDTEQAVKVVQRMAVSHVKVAKGLRNCLD